MLARYALAAKKQGLHWDMNSLLFDEKPENEEKLLEMSKNLDLDVDKLKADANSQEIKDELSKEIEEAFNYKISGTPCIVINGKLIKA